MRLVIYVFCAAAFVADITHRDILAFGVFYIPLVGTAVFHRDPTAAWWLAAIATTLVIIGFVVPGLDTELIAGLTNRMLSIVAILITAYLIHHEGQIRARLAAQTERAEAADRAKTQLFNNLTHEVRTPLAAILGFADLPMAKARADQRGSIGHIQSSGRRLMATLDNLIDLTQIRDRALRIRPIDLAAVLMQAVEDSRALAQDKEIALTLAPPELALPRVMADGWALRRITDNLIANGIKFTHAGGSVEVSARPGELGAIVTVRDSGTGMPPDVLEQIGVRSTRRIPVFRVGSRAWGRASRSACDWPTAWARHCTSTAPRAAARPHRWCCPRAGRRGPPPSAIRCCHEPTSAGPPRRLPLVPLHHHALDGQ